MQHHVHAVRRATPATSTQAIQPWARLRAQLPASTAVDHRGDLLTLTRGTLTVQVNFAVVALPLERDETAEILWRSQPHGEPLTLRTAEAVWLHHTTSSHRTVR